MVKFVESEISLLENSTFEYEDFNVDNNCFNGSILEAVPPPTVQAVIPYSYLLISLLSLIGNVIVIFVQLYGDKPCQNIRKYLINLALSDLVIGVLCVPFNYSHLVYGQWLHPHWLCPTVQYVQPLCVLITSATLSLIGLERYLFALHPLSTSYRFIQSHTRAILISTWILGLLYAYLLFGHAHIKEFRLEGQIYYECTYSSTLTVAQRRLFMSVNFVLSFVCPFGALLYTYSAIMKTILLSTLVPQFDGIQLDSEFAENNTEIKRNSIISIKLISDFFTQSRLLSSSTFSEIQVSESVKNRQKTIKMLLVIVLLYCLCWMPIKLYQFGLEFDLLDFCTKEDFDALICVYLACHWLALANSAVNPIVYALMNASFRHDFVNICNKISTFIDTVT